MKSEGRNPKFKRTGMASLLLSNSRASRFEARPSVFGLLSALALRPSDFLTSIPLKEFKPQWTPTSQ
jgi:hypothetical protein